MPRVLVVLCLVLAAAEPAAGALPRSEVDRLDDVRGPQIHFVYAVPADGEDRRLDETGALEGSVASFQAWLAAETGGPNLRVDTYQGSLDVSFIRLAASDATLAARGAHVRDGVEAELRAVGFERLDRIYAVYYDGSSTYACGGAFWPPLLHGNAVVMYLRGRPPGAFCGNAGFGAASAPPTYWEYAMLHDILHGLGIVATCAPHHHLNGHVSDFANDLMWSGNQPWSFPARLDIGRDDYYGHGRADCADLARSPYLTSNPPPPPVLEVVRLTVPDRARPGKTFDASLEIALDFESVPTGAARCAAKLGTRPLRPVAASFGDSTARCRWRLPATARGKRLTGSVQAVVGSLSAKRTFTRVVR